MKISFVQSGGFMGMLTGCELDTEGLAPDTAQELEQIANASGLVTSGTFFSESSRDLYQYDITIEDGDSAISVIYDDATLPASAQSLVDYLQEHAVPKPLTNG